MVAKTRNLAAQFPKLGSTRLENLLVAGCSYVWNNSEQHICSWPYYLRDFFDFKQVYDCSQSGGGPENVFHAVLNELSTNPKITAENTMIIVMWPELSRTDLIVKKDVLYSYAAKPNTMPKYWYNNHFSNLSLGHHDPGMIWQFCKDYKKIVISDAQEYQSLLKIIALHHVLDNMHYKKIFFSWKPYDDKMLRVHEIDDRVIAQALRLIAPLITLDEFAEKRNLRIPNDGHPSSDAHLLWTKQHLVPYLKDSMPDVFV